MKPQAPAGLKLWRVVRSTREKLTTLEISGRRLDPYEFEMAVASDKATLQRLYPGAVDLEETIKGYPKDPTRAPGYDEPGQAQADEP